jgi:hypothetical protein
MRQHMRRVFDELWIIDLEGDSLGARRTENVFAIRTPVAIAVGVRYGQPKPDEPAEVHYARLEGKREEKLEQLAGIQSFSGLEWRACPKDWKSPFLPEGAGDYYAWPLLTDLFPLQLGGVKIGRTWPFAPDKEVLQRRWERLVSSNNKERAALFKDSPTGRKAAQRAPQNLPQPTSDESIASVTANSPFPKIARYGYRTLDRQWILADGRLIDRPSPGLWHSYSPKQVFLISFLTEVLGLGPAATISAHVPDLHHFRGSFGGKHLIPLWRDAEATQPNITAGLLDVLSSSYGKPVSPEDFFAYAYGVLASPSYVESFSEELTLPGPRLPVTKDAALFGEVAGLGRRLIGWHTYGERMGGSIPRGSARNAVAVPADPEGYPNDFSYDPRTKTLHVGAGAFAPVEAEVWGFSVSGLEVLRSWLGYRMRERSGRSSSPLDAIRPERWTAELTRELLELLWVLEATVGLWPELAAKLEEVVSGPVFAAAELPAPETSERAAPGRGDGMQPRLAFDSAEDE